MCLHMTKGLTGHSVVSLIKDIKPIHEGFPGGSVVKNLPANQETMVCSLGQEDPLSRKWQPTPVFLPGKSHQQRSLAGYNPWGGKESDTTERLSMDARNPVCECSPS